jgi:hypothetical protein
VPHPLRHPRQGTYAIGSIAVAIDASTMFFTSWSSRRLITCRQPRPIWTVKSPKASLDEGHTVLSSASSSAPSGDFGRSANKTRKHRFAKSPPRSLEHRSVASCYHRRISLASTNSRVKRTIGQNVWHESTAARVQEEPHDLLRQRSSGLAARTVVRLRHPSRGRDVVTLLP